jgi:hypothetical protein
VWVLLFFLAIRRAITTATIAMATISRSRNTTMEIAVITPSSLESLLSGVSGGDGVNDGDDNREGGDGRCGSVANGGDEVEGGTWEGLVVATGDAVNTPPGGSEDVCSLDDDNGGEEEGGGASTDVVVMSVVGTSTAVVSVSVTSSLVGD